MKNINAQTIMRKHGKTTGWLVGLGLISYLLFSGYSCHEKNPSSSPTTSPTGKTISVSACKEHTRSNLKQETASQDSSQDCLKYEYDGNNVLHLKHINAAFNCCITNVSPNITVKQSQITIQENETLDQGGCHCLCLYDVEYELNNLPPGTYHLAMSEPYIYEDPVLAFSLDASALSSGQYCVNRTKYPWRQ